MSDLPVPSGLNARAEAYWSSVVADFEYMPDELELLTECCRVLTMCDLLQDRLDADGPLVEGRYGPKAHPAESMLRGERTLLSKLVAQLSLPDPETGEKGIKSGAQWRGEQAADVRHRGKRVS